MRFDMICEADGIGHRLTKTNQPWTSGQVERMNAPSRTRPSSASIMKATTSSEHIWRTLWRPTTSHEGSRRSARLTPYEFICKAWTSEPDRLILNPIHQIPPLNT